MSIEILQVTINELELLVPLFDQYRQFYRKSSDVEAARMFLRERIQLNQSLIYLAMEGESGTGFVQLYPSFSSVNMKRLWVLNDLYVNENYRGKGIGKALILKAQTLAKETGASGLMLETEIDNRPAQKLYDNTGFARSDGYYVYYWSE